MGQSVILKQSLSPSYPCTRLTETFPSAQFQTADDKWEPRLPRLNLVKPPETIQIDNVVGIWWSEMVRHVPVYFGIVVPDKKDLRKFETEWRLEGELEWFRGGSVEKSE